MDKRSAHGRAAQALDLVRLGGLGHRRPSQLSGGQQQRTALARALVFDPVLVLMDEPFGALDRQLREQMQIGVKQIHGRLGNTIISVTHDQGEAIKMSDRIAVAPPEELYERPRNSFVARFLGEANTVHGRVLSVAGGECVVVLEGGERVVATATEATTPGARTSLILRPERLSVGPAEAVNCFAGRIRDVVYTGDHIRYHAELLGRDDWVIKLVHRDSADRLRRNDHVKISWQARDCLAMDPIADAPAAG